VGAAQRIIAGKGATAFGVAAAISRIAEVVLHDQRAVLTVTASSEDHGCSLSLPRLVSGEGVVRDVGLAMSPEEEEALERSASVLRETFERLRSG
jgi:L-lactate dehydrogenase